MWSVLVMYTCLGVGWCSGVLGMERLLFVTGCVWLRKMKSSKIESV